MLDEALLAKIKSRLSDDIVVASSYATLFSGLKKNHPRKVAIVNPLVYMIRRVLFTATVIYFVSQPLFTLLAFLGISLVVLAYSCHEKQWTDPAING